MDSDPSLSYTRLPMWCKMHDSSCYVMQSPKTPEMKHKFLGRKEDFSFFLPSPVSNFRLKLGIYPGMAKMGPVQPILKPV